MACGHQNCMPKMAKHECRPGVQGVDGRWKRKPCQTKPRHPSLVGRSSLHSNFKFIITHTIILRQAKFDGFRSLTRVLEVGQLKILEAFHLLLELLKLLLWVGLPSFWLVIAIVVSAIFFPPLLRKRFLLCCDFCCRLHSHCHIFVKMGNSIHAPLSVIHWGGLGPKEWEPIVAKERQRWGESFGARIGIARLESETRAHQIVDTGPIERWNPTTWEIINTTIAAL